MSRKELTITIVGSGGDGVVSAGDFLARASAADGLHVIKTEAYGPQIRGGESSCTVRISSEPIDAQGELTDALVIFSWSDFARFRSEINMAPNGCVYHEEAEEVPEWFTAPESVKFRSVPFIRLCREAGSPKSKNAFALGMIVEIYGLPAQGVLDSMKQKFGAKGEDVLSRVTTAFEVGSKYSIESGLVEDESGLMYEKSPARLLLSGNEAVALGGVHAGCRFFAGYPITPSSEVLHFYSEWMPRLGGTVVQTEDELSAIGAVIGASFAGAKAMTATSGPGLSLMAEMIGLSAMAEIPSVIVNVQRGGPSTGNPTRSEQSDLNAALYSSHGDAPRVVLACSDVEDCFHTTVEAFNIAEEYQMPVIVLSDQLIGQRRETLSVETLEHEVKDRVLPDPEMKQGEYRRYLDTASGVSPMAVPGMSNGIYQTNGLEHSELGRPDSTYLTHEKMNKKRYRKLRPVRDNYHFVRRYGSEKAKVGILCWGSSKGPVKEAVARANARGESVAALVPQMLYPFPTVEFEQFLKEVDELLIIELSFSAQFYKYLRSFLDLDRDHTHIYKRSGGKYLTVAEVEEQMAGLLQPKVREVYA